MQISLWAEPEEGEFLRVWLLGYPHQQWLEIEEMHILRPRSLHNFWVRSLAGRT